MKIPDGLVRALQDVYERKFGQSISAKEAEQKLLDLVELIKIMDTVSRRQNENKSK